MKYSIYLKLKNKESEYSYLNIIFVYPDFDFEELTEEDCKTFISIDEQDGGVEISKEDALNHINELKDIIQEADIDLEEYDFHYALAIDSSEEDEDASFDESEEEDEFEK